MRSRRNQWLFAFGLTLLASSVSAVTVEVGVERYTETYQETVGGASFMQEKADMTGVQAAVTLPLTEVSSIRADGRYAQGTSTYTGAYQGGTYGDLVASGIDRSTWEVGIGYQHVLPVLGGLQVTAGGGYRYLEDQLDDIPGGYRRENRLMYAKLGLERRFEFGGWSLTPRVQYKHLLYGEQTSEVDITVVNEQNKGSGYDVALALTKQLPSGALSITPFLRTWAIERSDTYQGYYEPENTTKELGVRLLFQF